MRKTHKKIGMMYDKSSAIAVSAKIALAATGLARSRRPGRIENTVVNQIARSGVVVNRLTCPKYPPSGRPWSRLKAYTVREQACSAVCTTKKAVRQTKDWSESYENAKGTDRRRGNLPRGRARPACPCAWT